MKALLIICALFVASLFTNATPSNLNSKKLVTYNLPDLSQDKDFVKAAVEIYTIQTRIIETNSVALMRKSANGTLTDAEKNTLATNLGYTDYTELNNSFSSVGKSLVALKNKYAGLNDQATSASLIKSSVNKLSQEGNISAKNATCNPCFWQLLCGIINCIHNSDNCAELQACLCAAFAAYTQCVNGGPR